MKRRLKVAYSEKERQSWYFLARLTVKQCVPIRSSPLDNFDAETYVIFARKQQRTA